MDRSQISKKKYVYHVYLARSDGNSYLETLHIEKHPLIYANDMYLYYKGARHSQLTCVGMGRVRDHLDLEEVKLLVSNRTLNLYYWNVDDNAPQLFYELMEIQRKVEEQRVVDKIKADFAAAKTTFERAKRKYDALPDELKDDKEEN